MNGNITYTFDTVAVATLKVTTSAGEDAARRAAQAVTAISVGATQGELDLDYEITPGTTYDVTTVAPRGRACIFEAYDENGTFVPVSAPAQMLPEPIVDPDRDAIREALADWDKALEGSSGDAEYEAALGMADVLRSLL